MESKFKYAINCKGSPNNMGRMIMDLEKMGYRLCPDSSSVSYKYLSINHEAGSSVKNGFYGNFTVIVERPYNFDLDKEQDYNCALAIAAIREDEEIRVGDIVWNSEGKQLHRVIEINGNTFRSDLNFNPKANTDFYYTTKSLNYYQTRKATPEEIIQHFTTNKTTNMAGNKQIIGYKLVKSEYRNAALALVDNSDYLETGISSKGLSYISAGTTVWSKLKSAGVLELWFEPVYEDSQIKLGGHIAVKDGDNVKFGCQAFDLPELYAYKKLLVSGEIKAELSIHGTKISVEILDRLIEML